MAARMTDAQLQLLKEMYASGILTSERPGNRVTFQSMADLDRAISREEAARAAAAPDRPPFFRRAVFCRS